MIKKSVTAKDYWLPRLLQPFPKRVIESKLKIKSGRYPRSIQIFKVCLFMPCVCLIQGMRFTNTYWDSKAQLELNTQDIKEILSIFHVKKNRNRPCCDKLCQGPKCVSRIGQHEVSGNEKNHWKWLEMKLQKSNVSWSENLIHKIMWLCQSELLSAAS